ncbi:alpha/beta fold hydrolase [Demequina sp. NBRC 110054]|uniref:alpha/beta fold hydrolase n=1 Tax=Demequina sp. NBRC 110054 TaxID=1570343 RepID=UPI001177A778|nr:alpha/beta hydrolase [Demequina sp. NBRC 110054]
MNENDVPTQYLDRPGGRIAFDVRGSGPLVVLASGMGELRRTYRFLAPALANAGFTVATTDLRGHGDSDATFDAYGDEPTADDLTALVEHLGGPAVLVGNSMSAGSAVIVAARRPDLVSGLALLGPFVREQPGGAASRLFFRALMARPWAVPVWKAYLPSLYAGQKPSDFAEHRRFVVEALRKPGHAAALVATTRTSHALSESLLGDVAAPTLVVMGDKDPDFPDPRAEAEWIAEALRGEVVMVADAGHYPQAQQSEVTLDAVASFARKVSDDAARGS